VGAVAEGDLQPVEDLVSSMACDLDGFFQVAAQVRAFYAMDMLLVVHGARRDRDAEERRLELLTVIDRYMTDRPGLLSRAPTHLIAVFGGAAPGSIIDQVAAHARDLNPGTWVVIT
jgi:hypothetical protein